MMRMVHRVAAWWCADPAPPVGAGLGLLILLVALLVAGTTRR